MKEIKITKNLTFSVKYADGVTHHVEEGILFEANSDNTMTMHFGTARPEIAIAVYKAAREMLEEMLLDMIE